MGMRLTKPWQDLTEEAIAALPAQLGIFEIADQNQSTIKIGYAGGREPFGMRTALSTELAGDAVYFRHEFTHGYLTRWTELLMIYEADHGVLPVGNLELTGRLGRLTPGSN